MSYLSHQSLTTRTAYRRATYNINHLPHDMLSTWATYHINTHQMKPLPHDQLTTCGTYHISHLPHQPLTTWTVPLGRTWVWLEVMATTATLRFTLDKINVENFFKFIQLNDYNSFKETRTKLKCSLLPNLKITYCNTKEISFLIFFIFFFARKSLSSVVSLKGLKPHYAHFLDLTFLFKRFINLSMVAIFQQRI
jgi:hypothetical protein